MGKTLRSLKVFHQFAGLDALNNFYSEFASAGNGIVSGNYHLLVAEFTSSFSEADRDFIVASVVNYTDAQKTEIEDAYEIMREENIAYFGEFFYDYPKDKTVVNSYIPPSHPFLNEECFRDLIILRQSRDKAVLTKYAEIMKDSAASLKAQSQTPIKFPDQKGSTGAFSGSGSPNLPFVFGTSSLTSSPPKKLFSGSVSTPDVLEADIYKPKLLDGVSPLALVSKAYKIDVKFLASVKVDPKKDREYNLMVAKNQFRSAIEQDKYELVFGKRTAIVDKRLKAEFAKAKGERLEPENIEAFDFWLAKKGYVFDEFTNNLLKTSMYNKTMEARVKLADILYSNATGKPPLGLYPITDLKSLTDPYKLPSGAPTGVLPIDKSSYPPAVPSYQEAMGDILSKSKAKTKAIVSDPITKSKSASADQVSESPVTGSTEGNGSGKAGDKSSKASSASGKSKSSPPPEPTNSQSTGTGAGVGGNGDESGSSSSEDDDDDDKKKKGAGDKADDKDDDDENDDEIDGPEDSDDTKGAVKGKESKLITYTSKDLVEVVVDKDIADLFDLEEPPKMNVVKSQFVFRKVNFDVDGVKIFMQDNTLDLMKLSDVVFSIVVVKLLSAGIGEVTTDEELEADKIEPGIITQAKLNLYGSYAKTMLIVALHAYSHGHSDDGITWYQSFCQVKGSVLPEAKFNYLIQVIMNSPKFAEIPKLVKLNDIISENKVLQYRLTRLSSPSLIKKALNIYMFDEILAGFDWKVIEKYKEFDQGGVLAQVAAGPLSVYCKGKIDPRYAKSWPANATISDLKPIEDPPYDSRTILRASMILRTAGIKYGDWYQAKGLIADYDDIVFEAKLEALSKILEKQASKIKFDPEKIQQITEEVPDIPLIKASLSAWNAGV